MGATPYTTERGEVLLSLYAVLARERSGGEGGRTTADAGTSRVRSLRAGTVRTLRRDVAAERPVRRALSLISLSVRFDPDVEPGPRERAVIAIVDAAQEVLRQGDRVYRTEPTVLTFRLYDTDTAGAVVAMIRVEARARRRLAEHELPGPEFDVVPVDPGVVIGSTATA